MKVLQIFIFILSFVFVVNAQKSKFCGTVIDESGALIPFVSIEGKSTKDKNFRITSDSEGKFEIEVVDGIYKILFKAKSFKKTILKNQKLPLESQKCIEIELKSNVPPHQIT